MSTFRSLQYGALAFAIIACTDAPGGSSSAGQPRSPTAPGAGSATDGSVPGAGMGDASPGQGGLAALQKKKAEMLTSIWENSTTVLQYTYCENIHDGRGYTSGRAGFCTGTGDAIQVVRCFDAAFGTGAANKMHKYMPELTKLDSSGSGSTSGLDAIGNYVADWASSATAPATAAAFNGCQDQITDMLYTMPALQTASKWGLVTALTKAELYDAEINHGDDGVQFFVQKANQDVGNSSQSPPAGPLALAAESAWLQHFLAHRLQTLKNDSTWVDSVDRVVNYEKMRQNGNFDLGAQIATDAKAVTMYPNGGYKDSGYPACIIASDGSVGGDPACTK